MATSSSRYAFRLPDPTDLVSVVSDLNDSMVKIDSALDIQIVTAFPAAPKAGAGVSFSNDSYRSYFNNGTAPASAGWVETLNSSGTFGSDIKLAASNKLLIGSAGGVNLYRSTTDTLKTDDNFVVAGTATLATGVIVGDIKLNNGTTIYRNKLSSSTTSANTASEAMIAFMTIPANDAAVGASYRLKAWGTFGVTGTPTLTFKNRIGGVAGQTNASSGALTIQSGVTGRLWRAELVISCVTTGASGTWIGNMEVLTSGVAAGSAPFINNSVATFTQTAFELTHIFDGTSTITRDSTISNDFGLTATWSAASASNTITCQGFIAERAA